MNVGTFEEKRERIQRTLLLCLTRELVEMDRADTPSLVFHLPSYSRTFLLREENTAGIITLYALVRTAWESSGIKKKQRKKKKNRAWKHGARKKDSIFEISRGIVSRCKQSRLFRCHLFFFLNENEPTPSSFFREYGTGRCCFAQNIQIDSYIHTRGRTSMGFLLLPRLLTISKPSRHRGFDPPPSPPTPFCSTARDSLFGSYCSKSFHRDPLHCFFSLF